MEEKNEQLNGSLLSKNMELEETYKQIQEDIRRGSRNKKNEEALERL